MSNYTPPKNMSQLQCLTHSCSPKSALRALANHITIQLPSCPFEPADSDLQSQQSCSNEEDKLDGNASLYLTDDS